jgi:cytochrome c biogenesis protein CcmG, thiol:disulfide interchange protein DsbE
VKRLLKPIPIAVVCAVLALVVLLAYGLASNEPDRNVEGALASGKREPAPALTLPKLSGDGQVALADYRGKVVVLNYWASWCDPCRRESPLLERWHQRIAARGGAVVGVDVKDIDGDARAFIDEYGLSYPQLRDKAGDTLDELGIIGFPETFVIDRRGHIAAVRRGPVTDEFMREAVEPLLREKT